MASGEERVICGDGQESFPLRWENGIPFRVLVGIACVLSMFGATLIIVSYAFFRSLRNRARLVLVHISVMDLGTVLAKFVGNAVGFDRYYMSYNASCTVYHPPRHDYVQPLCEAQAFFLHFFTLGSVLWTTSLSVYLYFLLMHHQTSYARRSLQASYFLCYGLSVCVSLWLLLSGKLGFGGNSYCGQVTIDPLTGRPQQFSAVFGYDLWAYFSMTFVPVLYLAVHLYLRDVLKKSKHYLRDGEERFREALTILDYWFFLIPLMFTLLRMWTCMLILFEVYIQLKGVPPPIKLLVFYLSGIGDSSSGLVNGFLYVLLTKKVRRTVLVNPCSRCGGGRDSGDSRTGDKQPLLGCGGGARVVGGASLNAPSSKKMGENGLGDNSEIFTPASLTESCQSLR